MAVQEVIPVRYRAFGVDLVARYLTSFLFIHVLRATFLWFAALLLAPQLGLTWIGLYVAVIAIRLILTPFDPDGQKFKVHAKDQWRVARAEVKRIERREDLELRRMARLRRKIQSAQRRARNEAGVV